MKKTMARARIGSRVAALASAAILAATVTAQASETIPDKLKRQMDVMETIVSEVLVDSPNLFVSGRSPVHGIYLEEYGALFICEASTAGGLRLLGDAFVVPEIPDLPELDVLKKLRVESEGGRTVIWHDFDEEEESDEGEDEELAPDEELARDRKLERRREALEDYAEQRSKAEEAEHEAQEAHREAEEAHREAREYEGADREKLRKSISEWRAEKGEREQERYEQGREELIEALIDYGDTLTRLRDDQWIAIAVFFDRSDFLSDRDVSRLVLKAKMNDLRAYGQDRLSRDAMLARVIEEEY